MWVETLPNGKVRYAERYENPLTGKKQKISITMDKDTNANRKQAQIALQSNISAKIENSSVEAKKANLTLSELTRMYLEHQSGVVKQSTLIRNCGATKKMTEILGGDVLVDNLTAGYVRNRLAAKKEKAGTTNERLVRFKAMIRWGYEEDLIKDIRWLDKLKPLKDEEKKKKLEEKFLESNELSLMLDNMKVEKWRFLAELTALSGMRCGEALALEVTDIDFKNRIIKVTKTWDYINGVTTPPKSEDSNREIYMQDQLYMLCKNIRKYMQEERMLIGYRTELFMSDTDGEHLEYTAYNKYLKEVSVKVLNKKVTTHFMRHTHVALMAEQGVPLDVISRRLGHSDSDITKRIYFHITEKLREKDYEQIKNINII